MRPLALILPLTALAALTCAARPVAAESSLSGGAQLTLGGGHDTNALLQVIPAGAASAPASGWFGHLAPTLVGALTWGEGHRLQLSYEGSFRGSNDFGYLLFQNGTLFYQSRPLGPVRVRAGMSGGHFGAGDFGLDEFTFVSPDVAINIDITKRLAASASYSPEWRFAAANVLPEQELLHWLEAALRYRLSSSLALSVWGNHLSWADAADSFLGDAMLTQTRGGLTAELDLGAFSVWGSGFAGPRTLGTDSATQVGGNAGIRYRILANVDVALLAAGRRDVTGDAGFADRRQIMLALAVHGSVRKPLSKTSQEESLAPVVRDGKVRLRVRAPDAREVRVVGTFSDWDDGQPLTRKPGTDIWEIWLPLPTGEHRYRFVVDGLPVKAPDALRYVPDGFGGEDAVVEMKQ